MLNELDKLSNTKNKNSIICQSVHEPSLFHVLLKQVLYLNREFRNLVLLPVVLYAVIKHQLHVVNVLLNVIVHIVVQLLLYRPKVHRLLNYLEVVVNSVLCRVHWLRKKISSFRLLAHRKDPLRSLHPSLFRLYLLDVRHVNFVWISKFLSQVRVFGHQLFKILERQFCGVAQSICSVKAISGLSWRVERHLALFCLFLVPLFHLITLETLTVADHLALLLHILQLVRKVLADVVIVVFFSVMCGCFIV